MSQGDFHATFHSFAAVFWTRISADGGYPNGEETDSKSVAPQGVEGSSPLPSALTWQRLTSIQEVFRFSRNQPGATGWRNSGVFLETSSNEPLLAAWLARAWKPARGRAVPLRFMPLIDLVAYGRCSQRFQSRDGLQRTDSRVTVVERNETLIHREDPDVTAAVRDLFRDEGIEVLVGTKITRVEGTSGEAVRLHGICDGVQTVSEGTHLLAAGGRTPNTDGIGLERAAVEVDAQGHVKVNERLQTTAPNIWAVGDCAGSPYFTHVAYDDFRVVRDNIAGGNRVTTGRQVPFCLFTDPELARIGLSEREAQDNDIPYRLAKIPMQSVLRTRTLSETRGFLKALIAADDRIIGFTAFGVEAGEIMSVVQVAMSAGMRYTELRDTVLTHPTIAEGLTVLFSAVPDAFDGHHR